MRRTVVAILVLLVAIALMIGEFIMNGDWRYYTRDPSLWGVVAVLVGLAGLLYDRSNRPTQIWLGILAYGAYAMAFSCVSISILWLLINMKLSNHLEVPMGKSLMVLSLLVVIAAMLWWLCWAEFKKWKRYRDEVKKSHGDVAIRR